MSKTPEEIAKLYDDMIVSKDSFVAGYNAGYQAAMNSPEKPDSCEHILDMKRMVDVNSSSGWISVKDRLPEIEEWVLINGPEVCQRIEPPSASWKAEYAWNTDHESFYYPEDITHWMPLPAAPEEEV